MKVLVSAASKHGATAEVAEEIAKGLREAPQEHGVGGDDVVVEVSPPVGRHLHSCAGRADISRLAGLRTLPKSAAKWLDAARGRLRPSMLRSSARGLAS
jgi:hypothetical protein